MARASAVPTTSMNSRANLLLPIPGSPTIVARCGFRSASTRSHREVSVASSLSRPIIGTLDAPRSPGGRAALTTRHAATGSCLPLATIGSTGS